MKNIPKRKEQLDEDDSSFYLKVRELFSECGYERPDLLAWESHQVELLSSKVRTLDDMSEEEILNIEKTYQAKVIRRK